jgi:ubiquitin carboxyl-terminal hydrolase MINDY-3/4
VLATYSLLLSRGLERVTADVDDALGQRNTLIDRHGYASQELVNLLLIGRAVSNVFDGNKSLDDTEGRLHPRLSGDD